MAAWNALVDHYAEVAWGVIVRAGLEAADAALVSELTWLRLALRWPALTLGANLRDVANSDTREWPVETAQAEAHALVAARARRRGPARRGR